MSVTNTPGTVADAVAARHRLLVGTGLAALLFGLALGAYVGYDWFVAGISHEVLTVVSAVAVLIGVQVLVLTSLSSMLIALHEELLTQVDE